MDSIRRKTKKCREKLSKTSTLHYARLVCRSLLFLAVLTVYIRGKIGHTENLIQQAGERPALLALIWCVFVGEMIFRFFPCPLESMGCQKQFSRNFKPTDAYIKNKHRPVPDPGVMIAAVSWLALNGVVGALHLTGIFDAGFMFLLCLAFSVCDMVCILFFCPFQTWMMKNKCCGSCRIYNWDYAMMFTPLLFVPSEYTWSLLALAVALLAKWEITYHRHPERFSESANVSLSCAHCKEKLCHHKKQLQRFLKRRSAAATHLPKAREHTG